MTLIACPVPGKSKSADLCAAFIAGAPKSAEGFVFYGVKEGNYAQWLKAKASGKDWYFVDNSYFDGASRGVQFRVAKNRLQHAGHGKSDGARFHALGITIQPWQDLYQRREVILSPQSDDHMHYTVGYQGDWLKDTLRKFEDYPWDIVVRQWDPDKIKAQKSLPDALKSARLLVTHTSASAITAVLAGIPAICDEQCAAFPVADPKAMNDRHTWAGVLADNQWTIDEMKRGMAWRTLNP